MKLVCIGDTHNKHRELILPEGDVLIHAGDCTDAGTLRETRDFLEWFSAQPHKHKILIGGNHDYFFERSSSEEIAESTPDNIHYLQQEAVQLEGVTFWGSPYTPGSGRWAFQSERGAAMKKFWQEIPVNTQVIVTHGPAYGIMDQVSDNTHIGCKELLHRIKEVQPEVHISGHLHNSYGVVSIGKTRFVNCSSLDERLRSIHPPLSIDL